jgi:hypothetical protein
LLAVAQGPGLAVQEAALADIELQLNKIFQQEKH